MSKEILYRCMNKECGYELRGTRSRTDGKRCPKCKGPIATLREIYYSDINKNIPQMPRRIPMPDVKPLNNNMTVYLTLDGSEKFIEQLKDIEDHLDKVIEKQKLLNGPEIVTLNVNSFIGSNVDAISKEIATKLAESVRNIMS